MSGFRTIATLAIAFMLPACATIHRESCAPGEQRVVSDLVYFGTARARGAVTQAEWEDFLRADVTPRFPQGFTVWQASGQWRAADGSIVREASYVLDVAHPDDEASDIAMNRIRERYRARFEQESAMRVRKTACVSF